MTQLDDNLQLLSQKVDAYVARTNFPLEEARALGSAHLALLPIAEMSPGSTPTEVDDFALQARPLLVASGAPEGAAVDPWHSQTSLGNNDDPISSAATARKPDLAGAISSDLASSLYQTSSPLENVMAEALADNAGTSEFSDPSAPPFMLTRSEDDTGTINSERLDSYVSDGNTAVDPAPRIEPAIRSRPNYAAPLPAVLHKPGFLRRILKRFGL